MIASASCGPTADLLRDIGFPPGLPAEEPPCLSQPSDRRAMNENRIPFSVTVCRASCQSEARPTLAAVGEKPGCVVAEGEDDGESKVMPMTATIAAATMTAI